MLGRFPFQLPAVHYFDETEGYGGISLIDGPAIVMETDTVNLRPRGLNIKSAGTLMANRWWRRAMLNIMDHTMLPRGDKRALTGLTPGSGWSGGELNDKNLGLWLSAVSSDVTPWNLISSPITKGRR